MIEASKLVTVEVKSRSQTPSLAVIEVPASMWLVDHMHVHHQNYAATGDVVKFSVLWINMHKTWEGSVDI